MKVKNIIKKVVGLSTVTMMLSTNILFTSNFIIEELISYAQESEIKIASNTEQQENLENIVLSATQELVSNFAIEEEKVNIIQTKIAVNLEGNIYKPQTMQIHLNENIVPNVAPTKILVRSLKNTNYSSLALDKTEGTKIIASNTAKEEALPGAEEFLVTYIYNYINENNPVNTAELDIKINKVEVTLQGENLVKTLENQTTTLETTQIESNGINLIPEIVNDLGKGYLNMGQEENFEEKVIVIAEPEMLAGSSIIIEDLANTIFANDGKEEVETEIKSNIIKTTISKQQLANYLGEGYKIELVEDEQQEGTEETQENSIIYYENTYMQSNGIAYGGVDNFDVVAILDGTVTAVKEDELLGTIVEIRHDNNMYSLYQSVSNVKVKENEEVVQGTIIASSGTSSLQKDLGSHVYFEIIVNNNTINPELSYGKSINELGL